MKRLFFILFLLSACSDAAFKGLPSLAAPGGEGNIENPGETRIRPDDLPFEGAPIQPGDLPFKAPPDGGGGKLVDLPGMPDDRRPADFGLLKLRFVPYDPCKVRACPPEEEDVETDEDRVHSSIPLNRIR